MGIDFSKKTFDVSVIERNRPEDAAYRQFENGEAGCLQLLSRVKEQGNRTGEEWLFCGEHSGLYSLQLRKF